MSHKENNQRNYRASRMKKGGIAMAWVLNKNTGHRCAVNHTPVNLGVLPIFFDNLEHICFNQNLGMRFIALLSSILGVWWHDIVLAHLKTQALRLLHSSTKYNTTQLAIRRSWSYNQYIVFTLCNVQYVAGPCFTEPYNYIFTWFNSFLSAW